jgi:hypothetical protein
MLVVTRDGEKLSLKAKFVIKLIKSNYDVQFLKVFRRDRKKYVEEHQGNHIYLATSTSGIFMYFLLNFFLKNPKDLHDGMIRRLRRREKIPVASGRGFVTIISQVLYQYFARSAKTLGLLLFLRKLNSSPTFLVDEFFSLNVVDLRLLKRLGHVIYISSDLAYDFYGDNLIASRLMYRFEQRSIVLADLVIACSQRDKLKYLEMGAKEVAYYPNIYPLDKLGEVAKDPNASVSIVLKEHWGIRGNSLLEDVLAALGKVNQKIRVYMIGTKPLFIPKNIDLRYYDYISGRSDYLSTLSTSWIGINLGVHAGGSNQRKYDYAMAGLVVFSDKLGARGDLLPHEYTFTDIFDLAAKLQQLVNLGKEEVAAMGAENRRYALSLAKQKHDELLMKIEDMHL